MRTERLARAVIAAVIAAVLAIAPFAYAKGDGTAEVCGAGRCVGVHDHGDVGNLHSTGGTGPAPAAAPFYVVRFRDWSYIWVPSVGGQRADDFGSGPVRWRSAPFLAPLLAGLTKGLAPYPASSTWSPPARRPADAGFPFLPAGFGGLAAAIATAVLLRLTRTRRTASPAAR
ncbi:MAG: hypothetical protein QOJ12_14 [Thermoleophilales bacterium]|nr:hypothetical protein [Thermoleophilales bacterium]